MVIRYKQKNVQNVINGLAKYQVPLDSIASVDMDSVLIADSRKMFVIVIDY